MMIIENYFLMMSLLIKTQRNGHIFGSGNAWGTWIFYIRYSRGSGWWLLLQIVLRLLPIISHSCPKTLNNTQQNEPSGYTWECFEPHSIIWLFQTTFIYLSISKYTIVKFIITNFTIHIIQNCLIISYTLFKILGY